VPAALDAAAQFRLAADLRRLQQAGGPDSRRSVVLYLDRLRLSGAVCGDAAAWAVIRHVTNACGLAGWVWEAEDTDLTGSRVYLHAQEAQVYRCARAAAAGARLLRVDDPVTVLVSEGMPVWRARSPCRLLGLGVSGRHSHAV
jgi:hypothetical protein